MKSIFTFILFALSISLWASADVCGLELPQGTHGAFAFGDDVAITLEYSTDEAAGVRIFARPFTNGALTPGYSASGSPLYPSGDGIAAGTFTINSGAVTVDEIRVRVVTADQSEMLREFWIPVEFIFGDHGANTFVFSEDQKVASMLLGESVTTAYAYNCTDPGGCRIFIRPFTNGGLTPGYSASGSPLFTGSGAASANFQINSGTNVRVDELRVTILNADQSTQYEEFFVPVNWYWSTVKVTDVVASGPATPDNGQNVTFSYNYEISEPGGARIFARPETNGELTPQYAGCGSAVIGTGSGIDDCSFTITSGYQRMDNVRIIVNNADQTENLLTISYPYEIFFGRFPLANIVTCPPAPARLMTEERVNISFDATNSTNTEARIFTRPFTEGGLTPGYGASGSPAYPIGGSSGTGFFQISQQQVVDQIRFRATSSDQQLLYADYFLDTRYVFGDALISSTQEQVSASDRLEWNVGPNPTRDITTLRLIPYATETISVQVLDQLGRQVQQFAQLELMAGTLTPLTIDLSDPSLPSGMYLLRINGRDFQLTEKLIKL
ncbi:MAG: T9SS type A sorting domain-containing protein [Bacteroidota bacterium]